MSFKGRGPQHREGDASRIGGLLTTRKIGDDIVIGEAIVITLEQVHPYSKQVRLRIHAPRGVPVRFVKKLQPPPESDSGLN